MKHFLIITALILGMASGVFASDDPNYTDNLNLWKPDADDRTAALADANNNWETIDNSFDGEQGFASLLVDPTRQTGTYSGFLNIDDGGDKDTATAGAMTGGAAEKTYGLYMQVNRPNTADATGDSEDALIKGVYCNHGQNDTNFIMRGINTHVGNRTGGICGTVDNQIGSSTRGAFTTLRGLSVVAEDYYGLAAGTEFGGIDITLKCEGVDPTTTEYGLRIRNLDNSTANSIDDAITVSDSGTNTGFTNVVNATGATVGQAQIVFSNGSKLFVGAQTSENGVYGEVGAYDAAGSVYFATNGKIFVQVADNGAAADWEIVTSASAE